jgi:hypothetical protein
MAKSRKVEMTKNANPIAAMHSILFTRLRTARIDEKNHVSAATQPV